MGARRAWADDFHHALHALLTGERDGYYAGYGTVADARAGARGEPGPSGSWSAPRTTTRSATAPSATASPPADPAFAAACVLFAPLTPLLFMGEEYGEPAPFLFFTDHDDPEIAAATREGRGAGVRRLLGVRAARIPDPQARATFEASRLDPRAATPSCDAFYRGLIALRRAFRRRASRRTWTTGGGSSRVRRGAVELDRRPRARRPWS